MAESITKELLSTVATFTSRSAEVEGNMFEMTKMVTWQNYSSLSAFVLLAWDSVLTFEDEISLIWSQPSNPNKFLYLFARYFGLTSQLTSYILSMTRFSHIPILHTTCAGWYAFVAVKFWALYASCDVVLMMRVYDLYHQSHRVGLGLVLLHIAETLVVSICCWHTLDSVRYDPICSNLDSIPRGVIAIVVTIIFSQFIIWTLTFIKRDVGSGKKRTSLIGILEDGKWSWFIILTMLIIIVPTAFVHQFLWPHLIFFSWPSTMLSAGTCRILLNTAKLSHVERKACSQRWEPEPTFPIPNESRQHQQPQTRPQPQTPQTSRRMPQVRAGSNIHSPNPRVPVSSNGHHTSISYVSSRLGPSPYPTMFGDSSASHDSVSTAMTIPEEESVDIEIGSLHVSSSVNSEEMRRFWNEP